MPGELPVPQQAPVLSTELLETLEAARRFQDAARAANTRRAYASDWADFTQYCARHGFPSLPSTDRTVQLYISYLAYARKPRTLNPATIGRRLAAIAWKHREAGYISPTEMPVVKDAWKGIRRSLRVKPVPKKAIVTQTLRDILPPAGSSRLIDVRDRAILLLGFAAALRRSEIAALRLDDVTFDTHGVVLVLAYSKTNQDGQAERIAVQFGRDPQTCPPTALRRWIEAARLTSGPLFRRIDRHANVSTAPLAPAAIAGIVKRAAARAGLNAEELAAHSLRSGFVTTARAAGVADWVIKRTTRHKSTEMLDRYTHPRSLFEENASGELGL
jgi:site-specific recombinase XerD